MNDIPELPSGSGPPGSGLSDAERVERMAHAMLEAITIVDPEAAPALILTALGAVVGSLALASEHPGTGLNIVNQVAHGIISGRLLD